MLCTVPVYVVDGQEYPAGFAAARAAAAICAEDGISAPDSLRAHAGYFLVPVSPVELMLLRDHGVTIRDVPTFPGRTDAVPALATMAD